MPDPAKLEEYRQHYPQPCANFEADDVLGVDHKERFRIHLDGYIDGDYEGFMKVFFHDPSNKKLGPAIGLEVNEVLGSVRSLTAFASRFSDPETLDQDPADAEDYVRDLTSLPAATFVTTIQTLFPPATPIARYLMWSYRNPPHWSDPFMNIELEDVACRLGLRSYGSAEHVAFGHRLPADIQAFLPTCFDAGLFDEWRPGGKTLPLADCEAKYAEGLPEVVHSPNTLHNITTALHLAEV